MTKPYAIVYQTTCRIRGNRLPVTNCLSLGGAFSRRGKQTHVSRFINSVPLSYFYLWPWLFDWIRSNNLWLHIGYLNGYQLYGQITYDCVYAIWPGIILYGEINRPLDLGLYTLFECMEDS